MIIFAYNFNHRKTQDFILKCFVNKIKIDGIIAAEKEELKVESVPFKTKIKIAPIFHPKEIADLLNIKYIVAPHNSSKALNFLKQIKPDFGLIAGARIINQEIIDAFKLGIINFHPGDIPKIRGLNSSQKAIKKNHPQVVTSHLIDSNIDAGWIINKEKVDVDEFDNIQTINEKLYQLQLNMLKVSIEKLHRGEITKVDIKNNSYEHKRPYDSIDLLQEDLKKYDP